MAQARESPPSEGAPVSGAQAGHLDEHGPVSHGPVSHGPVSQAPVSLGPVSQAPVSLGPLSQRLDEQGRSQAFYGRMLDRDTDPELQCIVEAAASGTGFPMAAVTLVLSQTQVFRAHVGLPPGLDVAKAAQRSTFFCQFVVERDAPFVVTDATAGGEAHVSAVERYGMRSYVGIPLHMQGRVIGALCVIDTCPREVLPAHLEKLERLAVLASRRLAELSGKTPAPGNLISHAAEPAFAEIRNLLSSIVANSAYGRMVVTDIEPLLGVLGEAANGKLSQPQLDRVLAAVPHAIDSHQELLVAFAELEGVAKKLIDTVGGLEKTVAARSSYEHTVMEAIDAGTLAAHHFTKLIGGVRWSELPAEASYKHAPAWTGLVVSIALQELAARLGASTQQGIDGRVEIHGASISIRLGAPLLTEAVCKEVVGDLSFLLNGVSLLDVSVDGAMIRLKL